MRKSKKKSNLKAIDAILDDFDFEMVHRVMNTMRWSWMPHNDSPDVREMRRTARGLLMRLCDESDIESCGTGGFEARWVDDGLELRFILRETWGLAERDQRIRGIITGRKKDEQV